MSSQLTADVLGEKYVNSKQKSSKVGGETASKPFTHAAVYAQTQKHPPVGSAENSQITETSHGRSTSFNTEKRKTTVTHPTHLQNKGQKNKGPKTKNKPNEKKKRTAGYNKTKKIDTKHTKKKKTG